MGKSKIDPIIQRKLYSLATPLDSGALWAAIEREVVPSGKKTDKLLFFWLFGGLLCAAVGLYGYVWYNQSVTSISQVTINQNKPFPEKEQAVALLSDEDEQQSDILENEMHPDSDLKVVAPSQAMLESKKLNQAKQPRKELNTQSKSDKTLQVNTTAKATVSQQHSFNKTNNRFKAEDLVIAESKNINSAIASTDKSRHNEGTFLPKIGNLDTRQISLEVKPFELNLRPSKIKRVDCYDYNYTYSPISIIGYYGPGVSKRWLSNKQQGTESDNHFSLRDENESTLEGHRAGALLKFKLKSGFFIKAGIEVANINEKLEYESNIEESVLLMDQITHYIVDENGVSIPQYGNIEATIITNKKWLYYNQYRFIDIPVLVGYEFRLNRWNVAVEAGVLINQSMKYSDGETSDSGSTFGMTSGEPELSVDYYKSNTGVALQLGGGLGYSINKNITLWATPSLRHGLGSIGTDSYILDQNYTSANLLLGAELKF